MKKYFILIIFAFFSCRSSFPVLSGVGFFDEDGVRYYITPLGTMIRVYKKDLEDQVSLDFWHESVVLNLQKKGYLFDDFFEIDEKVHKWSVIPAKLPIQDYYQRYWVALRVSHGEIYVVDATGKPDDFDKDISIFKKILSQIKD